MEEIRIKYCMENNGGICPYRHITCDGLCNNCGLNAAVENCNNTIAPAHNSNDTEIFFNALESLIGYGDID